VILASDDYPIRPRNPLIPIYFFFLFERDDSVRRVVVVVLVGKRHTLPEAERQHQEGPDEGGGE
jgi:hypothetical protein